VSRYQKAKTNLDFTEARDSEWQWHQLGHMQVCTSLQTDNHASTPPLIFLHAGCPSCRPANSIKALKAQQDLEMLCRTSYSTRLNRQQHSSKMLSYSCLFAVPNGNEIHLSELPTAVSNVQCSVVGSDTCDPVGISRQSGGNRVRNHLPQLQPRLHHTQYTQAQQSQLCSIYTFNRIRTNLTEQILTIPRSREI